MSRIFSPVQQLVSPHEQGADFIELFFDLVFVYALTRLTGITAHHLDLEHILQSVLIFWLIWWAWTQFTVALNAANTRLAEVRLVVLAATGVAFIMATSISEAFGAGVLAFAIPYIVIRVLGIGLYLRVTTSLKGRKTAIRVFILMSTTGLTAVLVGAFVDPSQRIWWWLAAILLDMLAGFVAGRLEGWEVHPKHFAERHGLIVIIALGETLIVAASAVSNWKLAQEVLLAGGLTVLITCLLWWSYFAWINEHLEEYFSLKTGSKQNTMARDVYSFMHFPIVAGIIGFAVGFELILAHTQDLLTAPVSAAIGGGFVLFVGFTGAAIYRASKIVLVPRAMVLVLTCVGVFMSVGHPPQLILYILTGSLILLIIIEWNKCRHL